MNYPSSLDTRPLIEIRNLSFKRGERIIMTMLV